MIVVLAEKPAVAREIGAVLGATHRRTGYLEGRGYRVTWAIGHLVRFAHPDEIDAAWGGFWRAEQLPMLPKSFPLLVEEQTREQFEIVRALLTGRDVTEIVNAADAGREGELIFRLAYQAAGARARVKRLWISSLTPQAIRVGFEKLEPSGHYDTLAAAAYARRAADWLVGMNLTRAYTLKGGTMLSVGRVQTPTLNLVVQRDAEIAAHVPEKFRVVRVRLGAEGRGSFMGLYTRRIEDEKGALKECSRLPPARPGLAPSEDADLVAARARSGRAQITQVNRTSVTKSAPLLFDLTELQREANRLWSWTASKTLAVAQKLYEEKLLSYPRTDSNHLSADVAETLPGIVSAVVGPYRELLVEDTGRRALGKRFVDDGQVTDHHAIIPTGTEPRRLEEGSPEALLYDLVVRRLLQAWQPVLIEEVTEVDAVITNGEVRDRYVARGKCVVKPGWTVLQLHAAGEQEAPQLPAGLVARTMLAIEDVEVRDDATKPKSHFTEAELLKAMETAGRLLSGEIAQALKERGLGTPATRASIIETLVGRGYLERRGKSVRATAAGAELVKIVHPHVCSPAMTGEWECRLNRLALGEGSSEEFLGDVARFVEADVREALKHGAAPRRSAPSSAPAASKPRRGRQSTGRVKAGADQSARRSARGGSRGGRRE